MKPYSSYKVLISSEKQLPKARSFQAPAGVDKMIQVVDDVTESIITGKITSRADAADAFAKEAAQLLGSGNVIEQK